jgi:uncharacterized protein YjiS (DUF1127 family)
MTTMIDYDDVTAVRPSFAERLAAFLAAFLAARRAAQARRKLRRAERLFLSQMNPHLLRDIGFEPADTWHPLDGSKIPTLFYPIRRREHQ